MVLGEMQQPLVVLSKDYSTLLLMSDSVMTNNKDTSAEYIIAKALSDRIEDALMSEDPYIQFTENEVSCLGALV